MDMPFAIRPATEADAHAITLMIREFAEAEARPNRVTATEDDLRSTLFSENPLGDALLAVDDTGEALGYALVYQTFVPYLARPGLFIKNLFVREHAQRKGVGKALLGRVARLALDRQCCRLEWDTLPDNDDARHFYTRVGVDALEARPFYRIEDDELSTLIDRLG
jgi:GNAT superfamily N-acetyltransferase